MKSIQFLRKSVNISNLVPTLAIRNVSQTATKDKTDIEKGVIKKNQDGSRVITNSLLGFEFTRLAIGDNTLSNLLNPVQHRNRRNTSHQQGRIVVEGRRSIQEALTCQLQLHALIFSKMEQLRMLDFSMFKQSMGTKPVVYKVAHHDLKIWSTLTQSPGLLGIFEKPTRQGINQNLRTQALPVTVVCDNIREPNNLGSIIRTAAALPCAQVVITRGSCDPWEAKALRGGCGGHFRIPVIYDADWEHLLALLASTDSLSDCRVFLAESNTTKLASSPCTGINLEELRDGGKHNIVIIGGEAHGVSAEAYKFLATFDERSTCVHIPLANGMDSLNVTAALSLVLFKLKDCLVAAQRAPTSGQEKT